MIGLGKAWAAGLEYLADYQQSQSIVNFLQDFVASTQIDFFYRQTDKVHINWPNHFWAIRLFKWEEEGMTPVACIINIFWQS